MAGSFRFASLLGLDSIVMKGDSQQLVRLRSRSVTGTPMELKKSSLGFRVLYDCNTGKKMPKNKKPGHLNQEAINYEKQRQERIDMNNQKLTALGLPKIGSSQKRKSNKTKQAKNMTLYNEVDEDYQPPEVADKFSSSSEDEEELIPSQGRGKRLKTTAPPRSARRNKIVPPVEAAMAPLPAQDSLFALASSNSISGTAAFFFFVYFF
ncbi:hypothetical protein RHSIM_Rhsim12G0011900 [Rhododendron simsii]|uniref:Uncharacterized protein n=1 Tax=Rhododendron simsii TaxID=118357 RepID=A0A834L915_RHOSS|nr:hypothetical protein RHSIM_Rhsim12G0011900 [Rhododendron simsii]